MAAVKELLRAETDGTLSFGDYTLDSKTKLDGFEFQGDIYKVKTFKEITKLEKNGMFVYESVPGTAVENFKATENVVSFKVCGETDFQFTLGMEADAEYVVYMDDVNIGTFASAGQTPLVTISSADPLYVQFDMSESEYLSLTKNKSGTETLGDTLKLRLADGSIYQETGKIVQINPGLTGGQLTMKAAYANPDNLLVPGMYATVVSDAEIAKGSILVPTKALVQLLNRDMLDVVVDGKVQQKAVKLGATYGIYTIIESGIDENDEIIVEGQNKVRVGQAVAPEETTREALEQAAIKAASVQHGTTDAKK